MNREYWLERWKEGKTTGFHETAPNPHLVRWWPTVGAGRDVLVPLCGKSLDLGWLVDAGHRVTGVELSPIACEAVFTARGETPTRTQEGAFVAWRSGDLTVLQGDVFDLVGTFDAVWDRAATIALPPTTRPRYAAHIRSLLRPGGGGLLATMDYPQELREGPPFAVSEAEVRRYWPEAKLLDRVNLDDSPRAKEWGLPRLYEEVWGIRL